MIGHGNRIGRLIARALHRSWRPVPPPLDMAEHDLAEIAPRLLRDGESGLVQRRLPEVCEALQSGARHDRLRNRMIEERLPRVFEVLKRAGVPAMLVKGPTVARHYADRGLRPYGDLDIVVPPSKAQRARQALLQAEPLGVAVDLHEGLANEQGDRLLEDDARKVYARTRVVDVAGAPVRVLGPEDHLRLVCLHMLKHAAIRPLFLCDVAAMVETLPPDADLDLCLGRHHAKSDWVELSLALAHHLLGARLPEGVRTTPPGWLRDAVLRHWTEFGESEPRPIRTYLRNPRGLYDKLRWRWVNPLILAQDWDGPLAAMPRLRYQLREFITPGRRIVTTVPATRLCELQN